MFLCIYFHVHFVCVLACLCISSSSKYQRRSKFFIKTQLHLISISVETICQVLQCIKNYFVRQNCDNGESMRVCVSVCVCKIIIDRRNLHSGSLFIQFQYADRDSG